MNDEHSDKLEQEIAKARRSISSDGYPMSIGELTNMYREDELIIRPEFQRFFRWSNTQRSRFVESLLLGIPVPSIFVSQAEGGKWELIDGLQRVSTILQLQGLLKNEPILTLSGTKYLPALEGRQWSSQQPNKSLSEAQRLDIKRSKIDIKIIKRDSSSAAKYDLFQRLNSYGSSLTAQEMRSALLVAVSSEFFAWIEKLASRQSFVACTLLSDRLIDERFDLELVLRFLILHAKPAAELTVSALKDFSQVLDDKSVELASAFPAKISLLERVFDETFDYIASNGADKIFRKWDSGSSEFKGSFLNTAFEVFGLGIGFHFSQGSRCRSDLVAAAKEFWNELPSGFATGKSTEARLVEFIPMGRRIAAAG
ncbi:DUF262 domain-containing protein [Microcystis elabens FACHB-917]|nr:DUF262 domain-containing protein [Microcystis elabens FACHB-917]